MTYFHNKINFFKYKTILNNIKYQNEETEISNAKALLEVPKQK